MKHKYYKTMGGYIPPLVLEIEKQTHVLIAGATGSGKSTLINSILLNLLKIKAPPEMQLILIDLKKVELIQYKTLPHTLRYADNVADTIKALDFACDLIDNRYQQMQKAGITIWNGSTIYLIIDEYADVNNLIKKAAQPLISHILTLGRAAKVKAIISTQRPTNDIINPIIKANCACKIALRCDTPQESRNILQITKANDLPLYGQLLYKDPAHKDPILYSFQKENPAPILEYWKHRKNYITRL